MEARAVTTQLPRSQEKSEPLTGYVPCTA